MGRKREGLLEKLKELKNKSKKLGKIIEELYEKYIIYLKLIDIKNHENNCQTFKMLYLTKHNYELEEIRKETSWGSIETLRRKKAEYNEDIRRMIMNYEIFDSKYQELKRIIEKIEKG